MPLKQDLENAIQIMIGKLEEYFNPRTSLQSTVIEPPDASKPVGFEGKQEKTFYSIADGSCDPNYQARDNNKKLYQLITYGGKDEYQEYQRCNETQIVLKKGDERFEIYKIDPTSSIEWIDRSRAELTEERLKIVAQVLARLNQLQQDLKVEGANVAEIFGNCVACMEAAIQCQNAVSADYGKNQSYNLDTSSYIAHGIFKTQSNALVILVRCNISLAKIETDYTEELQSGHSSDASCS